LNYIPLLLLSPAWNVYNDMHCMERFSDYKLTEYKKHMGDGLPRQTLLNARFSYWLVLPPKYVARCGHAIMYATAARSRNSITGGKFYGYMISA